MSSKHVPARRGLIRQGDVLLVPVDEAAAEGARVERRGKVVLAEGEATGHAHRIVDPRAELRTRWSTRFLVVTGDEPVVLEHEEHDPLPVAPGTWEIRRQREFTPDLWRTRWVTD
jgi:hypothetical protein